MSRRNRTHKLTQLEITHRARDAGNARRRVLDFVRLIQVPPPVTDPRTDSLTYRLFCPFHRSRTADATYTINGPFDYWPGFHCSKCWVVLNGAFEDYVNDLSWHDGHSTGYHQGQDAARKPPKF